VSASTQNQAKSAILFLYKEVLGESMDVSTTMIYTHVLNKGGRGVVNPLDGVGSGSSVLARRVRWPA